MSLRRTKWPSYNRMEAKEETFYWMELFAEDHYGWHDDWPDDSAWDWYYYGAPGYLGSMDEYHQMKVLTLLRKLSIGTAKATADDRGW